MLANMVETNNSLDRTKLTFSQAEGFEPLPQQLKLEELSQEARSGIWWLVHEYMKEGAVEMPYTDSYYLPDSWFNILERRHVLVLHLPADEFTNRLDFHIDKLKEVIFKNPYNEVFDLLTFLMRSEEIEQGFYGQLSTVLKHTRCAYTIIEDGPTIIPIVSKEEGVVVQKAFGLAITSGFVGASTHLKLAGEALTNGKHADSVRESIHAVESTACQLVGKEKATLGEALSLLDKHKVIHGSLTKGFKQIYGYTSDEQGIRHKSIDGENKVDPVDAIFMFGACASFVTYLINKARNTGIID